MSRESFDLPVKAEGMDTTILKKPKEDPVGLFLDRFGKTLPVERAVADVMDFSYLNTAQQAESLWAVFQQVKHSVVKFVGIHQRNKEKQRRETDEHLSAGTLEREEINTADWRRLGVGFAILKKMYEDGNVRRVYLESGARHIKEIESINGNFEKYQSLRHEVRRIQDISDEQARQMFSQRCGSRNEVDLLLFETGKSQLKERRTELKDLTETDPELGALTQYETLREYAGQMQKENFIWVPSRSDLLEEIEEAALSGRPVLLSGESGTGKTRLVEQVALRLTGQINNETPGKDVRFQDLIAKPKISPEGATYYEYKEIGEAATGRQSTLEKKPQHSGRIVADDEFNLLPEAEQTERLARVATWTPGKSVRMPVTNQEVVIADDFLYCAMVNLASERYARKKIPPEVLRKFAKVDVGYPKQTESEPELYEMMLAALLDENGRIRVAKEDLIPYYEEREEGRMVDKGGQQVKQTVRVRELRMQKEENGNAIVAGGFLWRLSNALGEINKSFSRMETVLKSRGEAQYLKDMIIDIGTILGWMGEYSTVGRNKNLEGFFCEKMQKQFLSREAYTAEDRQLTKEFLKHYGIDVDRKPEERMSAEFEVMTPREIGLLSPRVHYEKVVSEEPVLAESFYLTPEGVRVEYRIERYGEGKDERVPGGIYANGTENIPMKFLGVAKEIGKPVYAPYWKTPKKPEPLRREGAFVSTVSAIWQNPETQSEQEIAIDFERSFAEQQAIYKNKLNLDIDEAKVKAIWMKHSVEIKAEIEKYGYDAIVIVPDNLPEEAVLNRDGIERMEDTVGGKKTKVSSTYHGDNFTNGGSFAGVKNSYSPEYRIVLVHSVWNMGEHPVLNALFNKNIPDVTGLSEEEVNQRIAKNEALPIDCEIEVNGKKIDIQAEGLSLEEYMVFQVVYFEQTGKHLDENGWTWLPKSGSGARVVYASWSPDDRQLGVFANGASRRSGDLGLRLSRSFS